MGTIVSAVFAGLTVVTDRPSDRPRYSVCSNRPYLAIVLRWGHRPQFVYNIVGPTEIATSERPNPPATGDNVYHQIKLKFGVEEHATRLL